MKQTTKSQFNWCHATVVNFQAPCLWTENIGGNFTIFYSYSCPKIVIFPNWIAYQFTFENSRKAGEKTGSRTTTRQCNEWLGENYRNLPKQNLKDFEEMFWDTRLDNYF